MLNVNSTGAKSIYVNGAQLKYGSSYATNAYNWKAGNVVQFMYNGSVWIMSQTSADLILGKWCAENDITMINGGKIATGSIAADSITAGAIITEKLAAGAVTAAKLTASDTMLANLLAKNATITGNLKIVQDYFDSSSSSYNTELAAIRDAWAKSYNSSWTYDTIPALYTVIKVLIATLSSIFVFNKHWLTGLPLMVYVNKDGTEIPVVAMNAAGLIVAPRDNNGLNGSLAGLSTYGVNARVAGDLYVGGIKVPKILRGKESLTFNSGWASASKSVTFSSSFSSAPIIQTTLEFPNSQVRFDYICLTNVSTTGFTINVEAPSGGFYAGETVNVHWLAIEQ